MYCRGISLIAKYIVVLIKVRDKNQFSHLARQLLSENSNGMFLAYLNATEAPHGYLLFDLSQDTDDSLRFRTWIFPDEAPPVIYVDIVNKTHKANYHSSRTKDSYAKIA